MATTAAILDFDWFKFKLFLIYMSPQCFLPSFKSIGLSVPEKKRKIDFQDGCHGGHLGFLIGTILAIFDQQATAMLPTKFQVNWPFGHGGHLGIQIWTILAIVFFYLQVIPMPPTRFQVNWPLDSGEEAKKQVFKMAPMAAILDLNQNNFSYF